MITVVFLCQLGGVVSARSPQNTTTQFQYEANGNLTHIADPLQQVTNFTIDPLNRILQQQQPAPVTSAARPTIGFTYDGRDQLSTVSDPRNLTTRYTNDGLGGQSALTSPDTGSTQRTFDLGGNLTSSIDARNQTATYIGYQPFGPPVSWTWGNGSATSVNTYARSIGKDRRIT